MHIKTAQGIKNLTQQEATRIAGENPDFLLQDLYEAIEAGNYPVWNIYVQVMDPKDAETYKWNIFDMTKVWPHRDYPLRQIGRLTLNRNVSVTNKHPADLPIIADVQTAQQLFHRYRTSCILAVQHGPGMGTIC